MIINEVLQKGFSNIERDLDSYVLINGVKYGSKDLLKELKINSKADKDGIWIGRAIPKMLNAEIINNGINIKAGDIVKPYFGVKVGDSYKYINAGTFYTQTPEYTEDRRIIKIVAYDELKKAQTLKHGDILYPITINNLIDLMASKLGVTVDRTNLQFLDYSINSEVYFGKDKTVIELINAIAQMNICFAYIDYDNILKFKRPEKVERTLNASNMFRFRFMDFQKKYNAVVISRQPQNDNVVLKVDNNQSEDIEIKLSNNPILDLNREFFITNLLNVAVKIPQFYGIENLEMQSNPLIEIGDIVTFENKDVVVLEHEITMTRSVLKSQILEKTETDYKKSKGVENLAINTELYVDKVKNEIVASIGDEVGNKLTELNLNEDSITSKVKDSIKEEKLYPTTKEYESFVKQTKDSINSKVSQSLYDSYKNVTNGKISSIEQNVKGITSTVSQKVDTSDFNGYKQTVSSRFSTFEQNADSIKLAVENKGKYRNIISNSDWFIDNGAYAVAPDGWKRGSVFYDSTYGTLTLRASEGIGKYRFFLPIETPQQVDVYTLWIGSLGLSNNVRNVTFYLAGDYQYTYSSVNVSEYRRGESVLNKQFFLRKWEDNRNTEALKFLRIDFETTSASELQWVRLRPEKIALIEGEVGNLNWDMTYLASNNSKLELTQKSILAQVGDSYLEIKNFGKRFDEEVSKIILKGSQIELNGNTKVTGGFKVGSNNISEIGGFTLSNQILSSGSGSSYVRITGRSGYIPILAGGSDWDSAKFAVSSEGLIKATDANIAGTINASSGTIGGFNISDNTLYAGSGSSYVRISGASGYIPILAGGSDWNSAKFAVSSEGTMKAEGANISGTINAESGNIGRWNITSNGIYRSGNGYYIHLMPSSNYPIFFGTDANNSRFRVTQTGTVLARAFTLEGGKVGGTTVASSSMSGGKWTSANGSGSFSGSASFSSGSYSGSGYLSSGSTLAGHRVSSSQGMLHSKDGVSADRITTRILYFNTLQSSITSSMGYQYRATLEEGGWKINNSDIRLKENIEDLDYSFNKYIYDMPIIKYTYKSDKKHNPQVGVNANYLMKILPEYMAKSFLHQDKITGLYGANYEFLTPYLIKVVQEQNERLKKLEEKSNG